MRCPFCGHDDTQVKDSRPADDNAAIRRRRQCPGCGARFTTFERVQLREFVVIKSDGGREPFDRAKLVRSMRLPLRKRPVSEEQLERTVNDILNELDTMGELDIISRQIGELVMRGLLHLDHVAYVRYASVYRDFRDPTDFREFVATLQDASSAGLNQPELPGITDVKPNGAKRR
ncbi:MAG: transcriptional repressor NrdR [Alphaproteobacteria bacterium]|nr:MAG: transcriptional repressor NrdR [Alphaproteobacteria bacterium]